MFTQVALIFAHMYVCVRVCVSVRLWCCYPASLCVAVRLDSC